MRLSVALVGSLLALGCGDPCGDVSGPPTLTLAGSNEAGDLVEAFADGAERALIAGPQLGMHIWLNVSATGLCLTQSRVDRRVVVDATNEIVDLQLGPVRFVEDEPGAFVIDAPFTMFMCPSTRPIIDERFRFMVMVQDADGRAATAEKPFVAVCTAGACDLCVTP